MAPALPRASGELRVGMVARMNARYKNHSGFLRIAARFTSRCRTSNSCWRATARCAARSKRRRKSLGIGKHGYVSGRSSRHLRGTRFDGCRGAHVGLREPVECDSGSHGRGLCRWLPTMSAAIRNWSTKIAGALVAAGDEDEFAERRL